MQNGYDLLVIGSGVAGTKVAHGCRAAGWRVGVVDDRPFGGTCRLRGCEAKKVLLAAAEAVEAVRRLDRKGLCAAAAPMSWPALMAFKRTFTDPAANALERSLAQAGIDRFHGRARFVGPGTLQVGDRRIEARHVLIATGARPVDLPIDGAHHLRTSDDFLELDHLPRRLLFIGGGYVGFEFAHLAARAGARVTVLERATRPLYRFDPDLVGMLVERTADLSVELRLGTEVRAIERSDDGYRVLAFSGEQRVVFETDLVFHAAGRVPNLEALDLPAAGVDWSPAGVRVNEFLQSPTNPRVYATGDAAPSGLPLTPAASYGASVITENLLHGNQRRVDCNGMTTVLFTLPHLARAGMLEAEAQERGLRYRVNHQKTAAWFSARHVGEPCAGHKVLIEEGTERILGAHLIGPLAAELINLFALAMRKDLRTSDLREALFAYPTGASDLPAMI